MRNQRWSLRNAHGQNLALMAGAMLLLLGVLTIAIDAGSLYVHRRDVQNAADAGALAGAQNLCFDHGTKNTAEAEAIRYATTQNRAASASACANLADYSVTVTATETTDTLLMAGLILGTNDSQVGAVAKAACGPSQTACGLFPVAFKQSQWDLLRNTCGKHFYAWAGDLDSKEINNDSDGKEPDCDVCNCDTDGNPANGDEVISERGRAWLDFTDVINQQMYPDSCAQSNGCGASELKCWINAEADAPISLPACIAGDTGVKAGVKKAIEDRAKLGPPGNIVRLPIYDTEACAATVKDNCSSKYHVVEWGCVEIIGWVKNWNWSPRPACRPPLQRVASPAAPHISAGRAK